MTTKLSIKTLGGLTLQVDERPITNLASRKAEALLVYLAIEQRPIPRELLADLLWDDRSQSQALGNLRVVLSSLHQQLPDFVEITRTTAAINPQADIWIDALTIEAAFAGVTELTPATIDKVAQALAYYQGDFLAGFFLREACGFEAWQVRQREYYHQLVREAAHRLVSYYEDAGNLLASLDVTYRLLALDPLDEIASRQMMRLMARQGQRDVALVEFASSRQRLWDELGLEPEPATLALAEAIRAGEFTPTPVPDTTTKVLPCHNLPTQRTALIGRTQELNQIAELLAQPDTRLVTLVGVGGMGKTCLALAAAAQQFTTGLYPDGVFLVSLASLSQPSGMVSTLAEAIQYPFQSGDSRPLRQQVLDFLARKQMLLLFDNFEHLLDGADLVDNILKAAPGVKVLVTSREPLRLYAEQLMPLAGLAFAKDEVTAEDAAAQLFLRRARYSRPGVVMTKEDWLHLTTICHQVGGMPLGLEMAAAWADALPLAHIAADLSQSLDLLETDLRDVPERQRSMRVVFDASWQRLSEAEQNTFAHLSVFRGGFNSDAAAAVCAPETSAPVFRRLLASLTRKSLLNYDAAADRYHLHELMRQYGDEKLKADPATAHLAQDRHSAYYCGFLRDHTETWHTAQQMETRAVVLQEAGNVQLAWHWAMTQGQWQRMSEAMLSMSEFYEQQGRSQEAANASQQIIDLMEAQANGPDGLRLWSYALSLKAGVDLNYTNALKDVQQSLALLERPELVGHDIRREKAQALFVRGLRLWLFKDNLTEVQHLFAQSLALYQELNDQMGCALVWLYASGVDWAFGSYDLALSQARAALTIFQERGARIYQIRCLCRLAAIYRNLGQLDESERLGREALTLGQGLGDSAGVYDTLPHTLTWQGKLDEAQQLARKNQEIALDAGNRRIQAETHYRLAEIWMHQGHYQLAHAEATKGMALTQALGNHSIEAPLYGVLGQLALVESSWHEAQTWFAQSGETFTRIQFTFYNLAPGGLGFTAYFCDQPDEARHHLAKALSDALAIKAYMPVLFALAGVALFLAKYGSAMRAVELWAVVQCQPLVAHSRWFAEVVGQVIEERVTTLTPEVAAAALKRGQALDFWATAQVVAQEL